jgi:serine/threonine-protein kinase
LLTSDASDAGFLDSALMVRTLSHTGLTAGARVGSYEIVAPLAAGAMGEVYHACDTKLNRDVALKVLPERFALDSDRLARFRREAQLLATLNHSNIAAIYGLEESNGSQALVLELVDGPTLADRIADGPISLKDALPIARQLAEALEAAHDRGIIHRDLKPANIKIARNGVVKVLDFGLAKVWDGASQLALSASATLTATDIGGPAILGTPAYMSPEQARGQSLDRRTDLWSFGCVLYEMLTGRAPFAGDSISDTLAAILDREPDDTKLPADTPVPIRRLLRRCLEKDRKGRLDSAAGARLEIDDAIASPAAEALAAMSSPRVTAVAIAALAGAVAIAAAVVWALMRPALVAPTFPSRFAIVPPPAQPLNVSGPDRDIALSPDGRHLVYRFGGTSTAGSPLMVRAIDQLDAQPVANVIRAYAPFLSPDSRWIGFFENADLKKVSIAGGPAITLSQVSGVPLGASWGDDNTITFATSGPSTGLWRVSADGGEPTVLTTPEQAQHEGNHAFPSVLPRGRGVLFTITATGRADSVQVAVLDLKTGQRKTLIRGGGDAQYVETGHLVFVAAGALRAVRFDPVRLEVLGDPVTVVEHVMTKPSGAANYAVSRSGTLVYMPGGPGDQAPMRSLVWVDRKGHEEPINAPQRSYGPPRVSPDGTRLAFGILDQGNAEIWIWDLARETLRRLTFAPGMDGLPLWTPDSRRIIFMSDRTGVLNLYSQAADGSGPVDRLTTSAVPQWPTAITPDGTWLAGFHLLPSAIDAEVIFFPLRPVPAPRANQPPGELLARSRFIGGFAEFSPDGRYVAYQSDESGRLEVYVRPFPQVDRGRWQISTAGGTRPAWGRNGRELFYLDGSNTFTAAPVQTSGPTFIAGNPAKVFDGKYIEPNPARHYDISPDGQRFLMIKGRAEDPNATPASMIVVEHWFDELKQRLLINGK